MSLEKKIARRNKGIRTVRVTTAATAVGSAACTGVIVAALAAQSGALSAPAAESVTVPSTDASQVVSIRSVVGKDKAKPAPKPKPTPTPAPPVTPPQPSNNGGNGGSKSHGS